MNFWENVDKLGEADKFLPLIKKGLELYPDRKDGGNFWIDFSNFVTANANLACEFFGMPRSDIASLKKRIKNLVEKANEENLGERRKNKLVSGS